VGPPEAGEHQHEIDEIAIGHRIGQPAGRPRGHRAAVSARVGGTVRSGGIACVRGVARVRGVACVRDVALALALLGFISWCRYVRRPLVRIGIPASGFAVLAVAAIAITAAFVPDVGRAHLAALEGARGGAARAAFTAQPRLPLVLLGVALAFFGVTVSVNFLSLRIADLGGTPGDIALSSAVASLAEIPASLVAGRIAARIGLRGLFIGSTLIYAAALGSWVVIDSVGVIVATRALTGAAFAGLFVAIVLTIQSTLPAPLQGTGQGLFQATAFGATAIVANLVGGFVFEAIGPGFLFALSAVLSCLAVAVAWVALPVRARPTSEPVPLPPAHG